MTDLTHPPSDGPLVIDCDDCIGPSIGACEDCVVTFLCERDPDDAIVIDEAEERALRLLAEADLVPRLRHRGVGSGAS
jgi:hypothetical protein